MRQYPRTVWVLSPTFVPQRVTVVKTYPSQVHQGYDITAKGKAYHLSEMFDSEEAAIANGMAQIAKQYKDLEGRKAKIEKRHANLMVAQAAMANKENNQ